MIRRGYDGQDVRPHFAAPTGRKRLIVQQLECHGAQKRSERWIRQFFDRPQACAPLLRERGCGHIVQIYSVGSVGVMPLFGRYNASKWALCARSRT